MKTNNTDTEECDPLVPFFSPMAELSFPLVLDDVDLLG